MEGGGRRAVGVWRVEGGEWRVKCSVRVVVGWRVDGSGRVEGSEKMEGGGWRVVITLTPCKHLM